MKSIISAVLTLSLAALPMAADAQVVVRTRGRHTRVTTVVAPGGGTAVVVNPLRRGNTTIVRTGRRGNTVINTPGPGRVVVRHR